MNPMLRPKTKIPFKAPMSTNSSASSLQCGDKEENNKTADSLSKSKVV